MDPGHFRLNPYLLSGFANSPCSLALCYKCRTETFSAALQSIFKGTSLCGYSLFLGRVGKELVMLPCPSGNKVGGTKWALLLRLLPPTLCAVGLERQCCWLLSQFPGLGGL